MFQVFSFRYLIICLVLFVSQLNSLQAEPLRIGVVGLVHTHVHWILGREAKGDIEIVGIVEPNRELARRYARQHGFNMGLVYSDLKTMLRQTKPEAVTAFNTIYGHLEVVEACAPKGIHVMVEKPLAVSLEHAKKMKELAREHGIHLLTNYETTWYGSNHELYKQVVTRGKMGEIRKIVVHDGHPGPIEIGCNPEFVEWLIDPKWNGGGAITDFGCYGANLTTWLMKNERPISVMAITQQFKPEIYPKVDDEATIIVTYPNAQAIIQASWNWPVNRKDLHVYGKSGYVKTIDGQKMISRITEEMPEKAMEAAVRPAPYNDPFAYFEAVVRGKIKPNNDLSSLKNNMIVMEILEAAKKSAKTGKVVKLKK